MDTFFRKGLEMGRKLTAFSDLSGKEAPEDQLGKLVIEGHPELTGTVFLEALPPEVSALEKANVQVVTVKWMPPSEGEPKQFTLVVRDFAGIVSADTLGKAQPFKTGRRSSGEDGIDYATMEHAGRPHRGNISPKEAAFVRDNLAAVNERLAREGHRLIDPTNKEHKERYGL
jgi:hypothetical protein